MVSASVNLRDKKICVLSDEAGAAKASYWAEFFKCPVNPADVENYFFRFHVESDHVFVRDAEKRTLEIDFDENHLDYQRRGHQGKNELIAKALGYAKGCRKVLDLSVGMGKIGRAHV